MAGYGSLISLPLGHKAAENALQLAAKRGAMKPLSGKLSQVRAARTRVKVGELDRTLVVVESEELLKGQRRGIAVALRKAKKELRKLERLVANGRIAHSTLQRRVVRILAREHLSRFVVAEIGGDETTPTLRWHVDTELRRQLEKTRLGRRVLCTDRHLCSTDGSCTPSVDSGMSRNCSAVPRKAASSPGPRRSSGRMDRCACTRSLPSWG